MLRFLVKRGVKQKGEASTRGVVVSRIHWKQGTLWDTEVVKYSSFFSSKLTCIVDQEWWVLKVADFSFTWIFADKLQTGLAIADIDHSVLRNVRLRMPIEQVNQNETWQNQMQRIIINRPFKLCNAEVAIPRFVHSVSAFQSQWELGFLGIWMWKSYPTGSVLGRGKIPSLEVPGKVHGLKSMKTLQQAPPWCTNQWRLQLYELWWILWLGFAAPALWHLCTIELCWTTSKTCIWETFVFVMSIGHYCAHW